MISAVFVDAGGVLFNNVIEDSGFAAELARRHGLDCAELVARILRRAPDYESGRCHVHEVFREILQGGAAPAAQEFDARWLDTTFLGSVRCHRASFTAVEQLRRVRPRLLVAMTNNEPEHWDRLKDGRFGHFGLFDRRFSSWQLGEVKPTASYFTELAGQCPVPPAETLLVDDRSTVLQVAADLGMRTLHVTDPAALGEQLRAAVLGTGAPVASRS
ncbi:HAD family hydrolase [Saccharopolyspora sp. NPDC000359]|uniref:HAD family hydrolase n=1 Tax=Saccharopolyspora sp. NPDC000359 TaxID=3154251 RepID=UPI0033244A39